MESSRGSERLYPDNYGAAATPMFRPPVKFHLHRPFEDHVVRRPVESFTSYLQYPDVHSTGLPLLLPPQHQLDAFQQIYQHQRMRGEATAVTQAGKEELELMRTRSDRLHDDSRGEDDERSGSPDSPTQLTGDEDATDDADVDDSAASLNSPQTSSPAANKCEFLIHLCGFAL